MMMLMMMSFVDGVQSDGDRERRCESPLTRWLIE